MAAFAEQGRRDWETILLRRARELAPGGQLVLVNFGKDEAGRYLGNTGGVNMFDTFNALWRRFATERVITGEEYVAMTFPQYYKTVEEFTQPLTDTTSPVYRAGLRLEQCETRVVPCPFAAEFRQHGNAACFAHEYIPTLRSWTESTFLGALSPDRPLEERQGIIDRYYSAYETLVRENSAGHGMDYVHVYLTIEQGQLERTYAVNLEAYELRVRAFELPFQGKEGNAQARQLCEKAIALDPTYTQAYTCTGFTYVFEWAGQWTQDAQVLERAWEYGQKAIALDDSLPVAHELLGTIYFWKQQYAQAIAELERALALGPSWGSAYAVLGSALNAVGRSEEAIDVLEKAIRLNPRSPIFTSNYLAVLGNAYRLTGRNEEAIAALKKSLSLRPTGGAALILAATYSDLGRDAEAQAMVAAGLKVNPYISLEGLRQRPLYRDPAVTERFLAALRKAGLQ